MDKSLNLSERQWEVVRELSALEWSRPMDIGGRDGSHHSATLRRLAKRGIVEVRHLQGYERGSNRYRLTLTGFQLKEAAFPPAKPELHWPPRKPDHAK